MNAQFAISDTTSAERGGYVVRRPRVTDATGAALRKAFDAPMGAKAELMRLVQALHAID